MKISITLLLTVFLLFPACKPKTKPAVQEEVVKVRTIVAAIQQVSIPVHSTGYLTSDQEIKLSFKTGGIIANINVREGDKVKKGKLLASLNLSEINAQAKMAVNGYDKALRDFNRAQNLYRDSVATLEQYQNASTALSVAKSNLDIAKYNQAHSTITAPEDGTILKLLYKENELVAPGYPVILFGSTGKSWKIRSGFPDREIVRIIRGDSAKVVLDAWPEIPFKGVVTQVAEISNPMTGTYETEISVNDNGYRFASGFVASVDIYPLRTDSLLTVPVQSLIEADGRSAYVFGISSDGRARKIKVEILTLVGSSAAVKGITGGLTEIVSEGAPYLRDGVKVEVVK
jgi:RND family efflux transporter MFP subunit